VEIRKKSLPKYLFAVPFPEEIMKFTIQEERGGGLYSVMEINVSLFLIRFHHLLKGKK